jgi:hypothetical protein
LREKFDLGNFPPIVNVRPGVYAGFISAHVWVGSSFPLYLGDPPRTITGTANNGSGLIRLTVDTTGLATGAKVVIREIVGTTEANTGPTAAPATLTIIDATHADIQGSAFANAYVSGGKMVCSILQATGNSQTLCFATDGAIVGLQNFALDHGGFAGVVGFDCTQGAVLDPGAITYHRLSVAARVTNDAVGVNEQSKCYTTGSQAVHFQVFQGGRVAPFPTHYVAAGLTVDLWINAQSTGRINTGGVAVTFDGPGAGAGTTGQRYIKTTGGLIEDAGTTWPGTIAGQDFNLLGPGASVSDNAVPRWDGAGGNNLQASSFLVDDNGHVASFGGNIKFPASQAASADANTLDDYEEGTWTPVLTFATPGNQNIVLSLQSADYTKVGREVRVTAQCTTSTFTHTTASGGIQMTGLPFTSANTTHSTVGATAWQGITKAGYTQVGAFIIGNDTKILFFGFGSAQPINQVNTADMPTGGSVVLSATCSYHV